MTAAQIYKDLTELNSLSPNPQTNKVFTELVNFSLKYDSSKEFSDQERKHIRSICSKAEFELECFWAKKIIANKNPWQTLKSFPYYQNYVDLTKLDIGGLNICRIHPFHKILFVGSGPLPLTAILLAKDYSMTCTLLEKDTYAKTISQELINKLGIKNISIIKSDALSFTSYSDYQIIYLAALVGNSKVEKINVLKTIKDSSQSGSHLIARSSWGGRQILYEPIPEESFKLLKPELKLDPYNHIVNSAIIFSL